jgi:hypothetical protein
MRHGWATKKKWAGPLTAENYQVTQLDNDRWSVTDIAGTQVYLIGPVEIAGA